MPLDLVFLGDLRPQCLVDLAEGKSYPTGILKTPQMAQADRPDADNQDLLGF